MKTSLERSVLVVFGRDVHFWCQPRQRLLAIELDDVTW